MTDAEIIAEVSGNSVESSDDELDGDELYELTLKKPSYNDVLNAISILEDYSMFSNLEIM